MRFAFGYRVEFWRERRQLSGHGLVRVKQQLFGLRGQDDPTKLGKVGLGE